MAGLEARGQETADDDGRATGDAAAAAAGSTAVVRGINFCLMFSLLPRSVYIKRSLRKR